jgi:hypothetical protein
MKSGQTKPGGSSWSVSASPLQGKSPDCSALSSWSYALFVKDTESPGDL